jgi:aminopeptidase N
MLTIRSSSTRATPPTATFTSTQIIDALRNGLIYDKGPLVLAAIHKRIGDAAFRELLARTQREMGWKFGSTPALVRSLPDAKGSDWTEFFDKYYWGTEMPKG